MNCQKFILRLSILPVKLTLKLPKIISGRRVKNLIITYMGELL